MPARRTRDQAFSLFAFQDIITSVTGIIILVMLLLTLELLQLDRLSSTSHSSTAAEPLLKAIEEIEQELDSTHHALSQGNMAIEELATLPLDEAKRQKGSLEKEIDHLAIEIDHKNQQQLESLLQNEVLKEALNAPSDTKDKLESIQQSIDLLRKKLENLGKTNRVIYNPNANSHKRAWLVDLSLEGFQVAELGEVLPPIRFMQEGRKHRLEALLSWANTRNPRTDYFILLVRPRTIEIYKGVRKELEDLGFDLGFDVIGNKFTAIDPITGAGFLQ